MQANLRHQHRPDFDKIASIAVITSIAFSLVNFRGPLIRSMVSRGVRVYALAPDFDDKSRAAVISLGAMPVDFSLARTGMHPIRDFSDTIRLTILLRRLKPDATFAFFVKPVIYGGLAARAAGVRRRFAMLGGLGYVFTPAEKETLKRRALRGIVSSLLKAAFKASHRIFLQNEDDSQLLSGIGAVHPSKVVLIKGTGVDLASFAFAPPIAKPPVFLLMARLLREKGIYEYVEAARFLKRAHPDARFVLLGGVDSNPGGVGSADADRWVQEGIIEWYGHVEDVRTWIANASVYVLPSYREGKPRSTQEAMAMGRPIITTDTAGCRDTVIEGRNGYLVPVRDWKALANAMSRFIEDPSLIAPMGRESRRLAEEMFDIHKINNAILASIGLAQSDGRHPE